MKNKYLKSIEIKNAISRLHKIVFVIVPLFFSIQVVSAQNTARDMKVEKIIQGDYCIIISPLPEGYGFDVFKNNRLISHQDFFPLLQGRLNSGLKSKTDAEKAARWVMTEHQRTGKIPPPLTEKTAQELQISH